MQNFNKERGGSINEQIIYNRLRVIDDQGQLGVMSKREALNIAHQRDLDLILISDQSDPPVAKILDANKYFYEQKRSAKEQAKKQRENQIEIKEVQFRPGIGVHDFETKIKSIEKFLTKGAKVKCMVRYKGRENSNKQPGYEILDRVVAQLDKIAEWDAKPILNGNKLIGILKRGKNE
jgi:translation initiation factor IF-3